MRFYSWFLRKAAIPIGSYLAGYNDFLPYLRQLEESQWWSLEQLRELQNAKLRRLIRHVYQHVPFYRMVMQERGLTPEDIQTVDDLEKLPIVDKKIISRYYKTLLRDESLPIEALIPARSSGSTGERLYYWTTKSQKAKKWAGLFRWWEMAGYDFGEPYVTLQLAGNRGLKHWPLVGRIEWLLLRHNWLSAWELVDDDVVVRYVRNLEKWRPKLFRSYASNMFLLARRMLELGLHVSIPALTTTGDTLTQPMRETIEQAFSPGKVFNEYGGDGMQIAAECDQHDGLHINAETIILEIVREGKRVPDGELGEVVLTNLEATATPFIRYNIHDVAMLSHEPCRCGRSLPRLTQLAGRLTDLFVTADGRWLTVHHACFFRAMDSVEAFQVVQKDVQDVLVKLVVKDDFGDAEHRSIVDSLRACMGEDCRVTIDVVDEIPTTPAGKRLYFISEVIQSTNRTWSDRNA